MSAGRGEETEAIGGETLEGPRGLESPHSLGIMWVNDCHKPASWEWFIPPPIKMADDWGMVYYCVTDIAMIWRFPMNQEIPQNRCFVIEHPQRIDDLGVPSF